MARSIIYIDGFNFYYGAIKGGPHKWLNLDSLFTRLRQADQIQRIYYSRHLSRALAARGNLRI
jgi:hypothetical protein